MARMSGMFLIVLFFIALVSFEILKKEQIAGSGHVVAKTIDIETFDGITLQGIGNVQVKQGDVETLIVTTDDNILPLLDIGVKGDDLVLGIRGRIEIVPSKTVTYDITVKDLSRVTLSGSGSIHAGAFKGSMVKIDLSGSGDIHFDALSADQILPRVTGSGSVKLDNIAAGNVDAAITGSGQISLGGKAQIQDLDLDGSGAYNNGDLATDATKVDISGSGSALVQAKNTLDISVNGSGKVEYYGQPAVKQRGHGSMRVTPLVER